jgi:dTDP-4-amino-4,6-dideoxygalactose transaminase
MGLSKLRPVGSRVPLPKPGSDGWAAPWADHYDLAFINSGTAALSLAVKLSAGNKVIPQDPEVILPAYGCPDLIAAVVAQGARPVVVDLVADRPWMDLEAVQTALTHNTVGIVAVGFLGIPERLDALRRIADGAGVALIEDSAQVFPPSSSGNGLADYVVLSFGRGKPVNLMGGGALLIRKDHAAESGSYLSALPENAVSGGAAWQFRRSLFNLLLSRPLYGLMERMPFLGIGLTVYHPLEGVYRQLPVEGLLEAGIEGLNHRTDNGAVYSETLAELAGKGWILLPQVCSGAEARGGLVSFPKQLLRYPLLAPSRQVRDRALVELNRKGIGASAFYGQALPAIEGVPDVVPAESSKFPKACTFAGRLITLPAHEDVQASDILLISRTLAQLI